MMRSVLSLRRFFSTKLYSKSHQWCIFYPEKKIVQVGISDHAQEQLGEIVHFEFPSLGKSLKVDDSALAIESVKTAADLLSPVNGTVKAVNKQLEGNPALVNQKAEDTWIIELQCESQPQGLMTAEEYKKILEE